MKTEYVEQTADEFFEILGGRTIVFTPWGVRSRRGFAQMITGIDVEKNEYVSIWIDNNRLRVQTAPVENEMAASMAKMFQRKDDA